MIILPHVAAACVFVIGLVFIAIGCSTIFGIGGVVLGIGIFFAFLSMADIKDET